MSDLAFVELDTHLVCALWVVAPGKSAGVCLGCDTEIATSIMITPFDLTFLQFVRRAYDVLNDLRVG